MTDDQTLAESCDTLSLGVAAPPNCHERLSSSMAAPIQTLIESCERTGTRPGEEDVLGFLKKYTTPQVDSELKDHDISHSLIRLITLMGDRFHSDDMITAIRKFIEVISPSDGQRPGLDSLCRILLYRYQKMSSYELDKLFDAPEPIDHFALLLQNAEVLKSRSEQKEAQNATSEDLDGAIHLLRTAVILPEAYSAEYQKSERMLGACLLSRYQISNDPEDLNEGIERSMKQEVKPNKELNALADRFLKLYDEEEDLQVLEDNIALRRGNLLSYPSPHPNRSEELIQLGTALAAMFKISGEIKQLDEGILFLREAVLLSPNDGVALMALALALVQKSHAIGSLNPDLMKEPINLMLESAYLLPFGTADVMETILRLFKQSNASSIYEVVLNELGNVERMRGLKSVTPNPFDEAREMSSRLWSFFRFTGNMEDLDGGIKYAREAIRLCPDNHTQRATLFYSLADLLYRRCMITNQAEDLEEALQYYQKAVLFVPPGNYRGCRYLIDLGIARLKNLENMQIAGVSEEELTPILESIVTLFKDATTQATSSPISERIRAAMIWAMLEDRCDYETAMEAYEQAIGFLHQLSEMGANLLQRQETLKWSNIEGLSRNAALYAIRKGRYDKAVEFLEAGRAVFWFQALQLRAPMDGLREVAPDLAAKFTRISDELERASLKAEAANVLGNLDKWMREEESFELGRLNEERQRTLDEIHQVDGLKDFLVPKKLSSLQTYVNNPVVFLIPHQSGSYALVMVQNNVKHVELPNAPYDKLQSMVSRLPGGVVRGESRSADTESEVHQLDSDNGRAGRPIRAQKRDLFESILEALWNDVVHPIVEAVRMDKVTGTPTRVTWCPTGIFSFLPIHAAGIYDNRMRSINSISDYCISSYTPTIGALGGNVKTRDVHSKDTGTLKMMAVIDPKSLPNTVQEMKVIEKRVSPEYLIKFGTPESPALVDAVASRLPDVSIVHFACHGKQLMDKPLDSALVLQDGDLTISRIMERRMPNASLAFLCACETAMGDQGLPDEAMHLGATLLFSGFHGVIATMWSVADEDGPLVSDAFYEHLLKDHSTGHAAKAIHSAIAELRARGVGFKRWVPFIHLGN